MNDNVIASIKNRLKAHHTMYSNIVNGTYWEEILYKSYMTNGIVCDWSLGSHATHSDIKCGDVEISCKSGKVTKSHLKFSSHRLTRFKTLEEKLKFVVSTDDVLHMFLTSKQVGNKVTYELYSIYNRDIPYMSMNWVKDGNNFKGEKESWKAEIRHSMSDQLWVNVPLDSVKSLFKVDVEIV